MTNTAAIIGGGVIGGGWLARFLLNGWHVKVFDPDPQAERKIEAVLKNARRSLPMLYDARLPGEGNLTFCDSVGQAVEGARWIQESVPERLDIKHATLREIENGASADAIIGSSTSGFKPSQLQEAMSALDNVFVAHPFNPVYLLPLVELVPGPANTAEKIERAQKTLVEIGMVPLLVRKEIDAHIADRFLEAVWREGLWLIKDGIATTSEIDDAIRYGFGLRWAQMGLFETYRIAGGEAGMKHFIAQFGPCLKWPWTKLMDVPELTEELIEKISSQSDEQSGHLSIRQLERLRDDNLVAMLRALKGRDAAAGALLNKHQAFVAREPVVPENEPIITVEQVVPVDWTDAYGHMNEGRYGQVFANAADTVLSIIGAGKDYGESGFGFFTVQSNVTFCQEICAAEPFTVETFVTSAVGKKLILHHKMIGIKGTTLAIAEQTLVHVDLKTRKSCPPAEQIAKAAQELAHHHAGLAPTHRGETA